ncbi:MAG: HEPN domain-containing protein [Methanothrix sp.]|nr:HEPN domain-containing protein [Methanothrix sp.]
MEAEALRSALSSAYLAVFHSARAVLFRDGVREKSHYCIGLYLQRYVEEGSLEENWPMLFDRIRSMRHADQYSFMARPTGEEVQAGIDLAERFIERMERLLQETG